MSEKIKETEIEEKNASSSTTIKVKPLIRTRSAALKLTEEIEFLQKVIIVAKQYKG
jgi:hypothetical protein